MKYGDSLSEPPSSSHVFEPQTCPATNPRDSESYGSLHSDDQSESGVLDQLKDTDEFGFTGNNMGGSDSGSHVDTEEQQVITGAVETNSQSRQTRTRFCVILWANYLLNSCLTINDLGAAYLTPAIASHWQNSFFADGIIFTVHYIR